MSEEQNVSAKTAKLIKEKFYQGGVEDKLESVGSTLLILGIIGGVTLFISAFAFLGAETKIVKANLICIGALIIFGSYINKVLLKAIAEIVRLLKKTAGLKFSGEISEPEASNFEKCSACDSPANETYENCPSCGARFDK